MYKRQLAPCASSADAEGQVTANGLSAVRAVEGPWTGVEKQLVLLCNTGVTPVTVSPGDITGAVLMNELEFDGVGEERAGSPGAPDVAHVFQDWDELSDVLELGVPSEEYYEALRAYMLKRHPRASETCLEHLAALEHFLDVCIAAGYSLGGTKSKDKLMQPAVEALGEVVGREGSEACDIHIKIIREWGEIDDVTALRRFLGTFNWVRGHFPKEVNLALPKLNELLRKGAAFPMNAEQRLSLIHI